MIQGQFMKRSCTDGVEKAALSLMVIGPCIVSHHMYRVEFQPFCKIARYDDDTCLVQLLLIIQQPHLHLAVQCADAFKILSQCSLVLPMTATDLYPLSRQSFTFPTTWLYKVSVPTSTTSGDFPSLKTFSALIS